MDTYLEIKVLPDLEITAPVLMNNLFAKLHRQLGAVGDGKIGVSFPASNKTLGEIVRLHSSAENLQKLMADNWLKGLRDYIQLTEIQAVPTQIKGYKTVTRIQVKSAQNMRKRAISRGSLTAENAEERIPDSLNKSLSLPYLQIKSLSNGQVMRIFIQQSKLIQQPATGEFSSYGLSRIATVPYF